MSERKQLQRYKGDTKIFAFSYPEDLTGYTFKMSVSEEENPLGASYTFQLIGTLTQANPAKFKFEPTVGDMTLTEKTYYYDIEATSPGGKVLTLDKDSLIITKDNTPNSAPLNIFRSDTEPFAFTLTDKWGNPVDIAGFVFSMLVDSTSDALGDQFTLAGAITNNLLGEFQFEPTVVDTDRVEGSYYFTIKATDTASKIETIIKNKFNLTTDITK